MHNLSKIKEQWVPLQNKVFSRWVSTQLQGTKNSEIINAAKDLSDGTALIELAQILTHKKAEQNWYANPRSNIEKTQNCDLAIDLFAKDGVKFVGISGKDISDNNEKLILGLIWTLISHYSIGQSKQKETNFQSKNNKYNQQQNPKNNTILLNWAKDRINHYSNVGNFKPYDLAICALLDSYFPDKIKYNHLKSENHLDNLDHAISVMKSLKIPVLIYPEDLKKGDYEIDEKTLLTQLSLIKDSIDNLKNTKNSEVVTAKKYKNDEKESESSSNSFEYPITENRNQKVPEEIQLQLKSTDDEFADDEGSYVESKKETNSENNMQINIGYNNNDSNSKMNDNKIRIKIKRSNNIRGPSKKVKVIIKNSKGEIVEKKYRAKVSKLHILINQNKNQTSAQIQEKNININEQQKIEEERIRNQKEEEAEIEQIEKEKKIESDELNRLRRIECEEEKSKELRKVQKAKLEEIEVNSDSELKKVSKYKIKEDAEEADDEIAEVKNAKNESFDQKQCEGKKCGLIIKLKGSDYNNGQKIDENQNKDGPEVTLALTMVNCDEPFLNSAGLKLDLQKENIKNDANQQFVFGFGENYTVVDSESKRGMVWDVANADETNPPSGTPFYLYPFHGRHNQRFIFENGMIHALQNNQVVTYVGGDVPLVMMPASENLKSRQTFYIKLM